MIDIKPPLRVILTHEQTDFDGLASLLGAHLLDETAVPILPRRINRNVRAFITLYGVRLPFVDPRDQTTSPIESITLVDTQSLTTIKGMGPKTSIHVVDHHSPRSDLPANWVITSEETGANTTLLVELIQERYIPLDIIQATLLLLGIYEDTGSLTYTRTTSRDVRAVAFLLDQGASLTIAINFLNHPLSLMQQDIYDQLRKAAISYDIHGHTVIVAPGEATNMDEELSTIAHKLRDLLDPDAIFVLITIRGGVQLIARSSNEKIDVSEIAAHFLGGGHPRAAAALIKDQSRESIHAELVKILPDFIHPVVTVSEIMSPTPKVISPDTPVKEIAQKMQRYGYEGFPVIENHRIVGLVTRRAVDRAIAHRLNLDAFSLMEAGEVFVFPENSIEHLQNVMIDSGWGQIPVLYPGNKEIIGIVTRTDLIKTLTPRKTPPGRHNIADHLEAALPAAHLSLLKAVASIAHHHHAALYIVGGFVRDLLLDLPGYDFDLVVEGDAIALAQAIQQKYGGRITSHSRFGTAKWFIDDINENLLKELFNNKSIISGIKKYSDVGNNQSRLPSSLDLITARIEFYTHPTALPTVERGSIKLDLHRRDFTINTLALRLDGHHYGDLHDYWGGENDLRQGLVRVLHSLSFVDDPTRMLRAVRYEQRYNFRIGKRTKELLLEARPLIDRVSGDRIRHELDNIFDEDRSPQMMSRLSDLGLLKAIHPELNWSDWIHAHFIKVKNESPDPYWDIHDEFKGFPVKRALAYIIWLIRLSNPNGVIKRLKLPRVLAVSIQATCDLWNSLSDLETATPSEVSSRFDNLPEVSLYALFHTCDTSIVKDAIRNYVTIWKSITPFTTGHDLKEYGLPPGPKYSRILSSLRAAWLDNEISTLNEEQELLAGLLKEQPIENQ